MLSRESSGVRGQAREGDEARARARDTGMEGNGWGGRVGVRGKRREGSIHMDVHMERVVDGERKEDSRQI